MKLSGAWPVLVTPYDRKLEVDLPAYRELIEWYLGHGVGGLYANCLSSEMYMLDESERLSLVSEAVAAAAGRVPVAATGNLGKDFSAQLDFCRKVADAGADIVMLTVPVFHDSDADLEHYYMEIAGALDTPLGLYECPVPRSFHLSVDLVRQLAQTGRFVAFKETSGDLNKIQAHLQACQGTPLAVLHANTPYLLQSIHSGCRGSMSIASTWLPDLVGKVIRLGVSGDQSADDHQMQLSILEMVERAVHPLGLKYLLAARGLPVRVSSRQTLLPLSAEACFALEHCSEVWFDRHGKLLY